MAITVTQSRNPHGSCASCVWSTRQQQTEYDGDVWYRWMCWYESGNPKVRMETTTTSEPPACISHLK